MFEKLCTFLSKKSLGQLQYVKKPTVYKLPEFPPLGGDKFSPPKNRESISLRRKNALKCAILMVNFLPHIPLSESNYTICMVKLQKKDISFPFFGNFVS